MANVRRIARDLSGRPWLVMPLVAVVALAGWWVWQARTSGASSAPDTGSEVVPVTSGPMARTETADGTVAVADQQDASFTSSGTVTAVNVVAGQAVTAGQVLATIDSAELEAAVSAAEADVASATAKLSDDTSAGASSTQLAADRSSLTSASDKLTAAQEDLAGAQLVAEFDGTVASVDLTVGEQLGSSGADGTARTGIDSGSGDTSGDLGDDGASSPTGDDSSTAQVVVVSSTRFEVELALDSTQIAQIEVGQEATISLVSSSGSGASNGMPPGMMRSGGPTAGGPSSRSTSSADAADDVTSSSRRIAGTEDATGTVTAVSSVADASSGVATYAVTVTFTDTSGSYNAGASVSVAITYDEVADALSVPVRAVSMANGTPTVEVQTASGTETREVETGLTVNGMVEITSGLSAGESVVISAPGPVASGGPSGAEDSGPVLQGGTGG